MLAELAGGLVQPGFGARSELEVHPATGEGVGEGIADSRAATGDEGSTGDYRHNWSPLRSECKMEAKVPSTVVVHECTGHRFALA